MALPLQTAYWRNAPAFFGEQAYWRWLCVNHGHRTNSSNAIRKRDAYRESHFATSLHPLRPNARPGRDRGISVDGISDVLHLMSPADSSLIHPSPVRAGDHARQATVTRLNWKSSFGRCCSSIAHGLAGPFSCDLAPKVRRAREVKLRTSTTTASVQKKLLEEVFGGYCRSRDGHWLCLAIWPVCRQASQGQTGDGSDE